MAGHDSRDVNQHSLTEPLSAPPGQATHENLKADAETLGETSGGFLGAVGGMTVGSVGGPIGMLLGGLAGAVGGWWAGREIADAVSEKDDVTFRTMYEGAPDRLADRSYDSVRPAYVVGHLAARNPDYVGRSFDEIEPDLQRVWNKDVVENTGDWSAMRGYARTAFDRTRTAKR
jgi:hypothetical protein